MNPPADSTFDPAMLRAAAALYDAGARAVWLFGSRARGGALDRLTDFDLAVEGLIRTKEPIARAAREIDGRVDVIPLEAAPASLRWAILRDRILIPRTDVAGEATRRPPLPNTLAGDRIRAVADELRAAAPRSVIDFGCGHGWLLAELAGDGRFDRLTGVDFDPEAVRGATRRLGFANGAATTTVRDGLITFRDPAFRGHDAAAAVEVIEHLGPPQLRAFASVVFDFARPARVVLTTPNREYNVVWPIRHPQGFRHPDHRFEWSRAEFAAWANETATSFGYTVQFKPVGPIHPDLGPASQLAVFDSVRGPQPTAGEAREPS